MAVSKAHDRCRICRSGRLVRYLDIGVTPLANSYLRADQLNTPEIAVELALQLCMDCGLSQLTRVVDPDLMFKNYLYVSSTSATFRDHCSQLAKTAIVAARCRPGDWILDIASNDGFLLSQFQTHGMNVFGVDPAANLAAEASNRGIPTLATYWSSAVARESLNLFARPKIITATNVLGHVDDAHEFVRAVEIALAPSGIFIVEVPYLVDFIEKNEFDTAYHEHVSYLAIHPLRELARAHELTVFDVEYFPQLHGGTIRVYFCRLGDREAGPRVDAFLEREQAFGITEIDRYRDFSDRVHQNMTALAKLIAELKARGSRIWAYGASAKGNTLMNFLGLTAETIPVVLDDNSKKWGLYTPGAHMRIASVDELAPAAVDHLLLLAWNFERELVERSRGAGYAGRFIRPAPEVAVFG